MGMLLQYHPGYREAADQAPDEQPDPPAKRRRKAAKAE